MRFLTKRKRDQLVENVVCGERVAIIANDTEAIDHAFALSAPMRLGRPNATRRVDYNILQRKLRQFLHGEFAKAYAPASERGPVYF